MRKLSGLLVLLTVVAPGCAPSQQSKPAEESSTTGESGNTAQDQDNKPKSADLPAACKGAYLELNPLLEAGTCALAGKPAPFPKDKLTVNAKPEALRLKPGAERKVTLGINNLTTEPVAFDLHAACNEWFGVVVTGKDGAQVDGGCRARRRCTSSAARFELGPGARAVYHVPFGAAKRNFGNDCKVTKKDPFDLGTYTVTVRGPNGDEGPVASSPLEVTPLTVK